MLINDLEQQSMLNEGTITLDINYWASHTATQMWLECDAKAKAKDKM